MLEVLFNFLCFSFLFFLKIFLLELKPENACRSHNPSFFFLNQRKEVSFPMKCDTILTLYYTSLLIFFNTRCLFVFETTLKPCERFETLGIYISDLGLYYMKPLAPKLKFYLLFVFCPVINLWT